MVTLVTAVKEEPPSSQEPKRVRLLAARAVGLAVLRAPARHAGRRVSRFAARLGGKAARAATVKEASLLL